MTLKIFSISIGQRKPNRFILKCFVFLRAFRGQQGLPA